jgi:competence protein ComEC
MSRRALFLCAALCGGTLAGQVTAHYINVGQAASALLEFKSGAVLIDAGGEDTGDNVYRQHLAGYLNDFFASRPDLHKTLDGVIISHPHIDHTLLLMDVMQSFTVHSLVDNGADKGSGIAQLKKARQFAKARKITYVAVGDAGVRQRGRNLPLIDPAESGAPEIVLLSGFRGCDNANNDSIAVRIKTKEAALLFAGDAEDEDQTCKPELAALGEKYGQTGLLNGQVYHVAHHGSANGTTADFLKLVSPQITVMSAGDPGRSKPGNFHAFQFGHPREAAVNILMQTSTGTREAKDVVIFPAVKQTKTVSMTQAVYCTCWDGDVKIQFAEGQMTPTISTSGFRPKVAVR